MNMQLFLSCIRNVYASFMFAEVTPLLHKTCIKANQQSYEVVGEFTLVDKTLSQRQCPGNPPGARSCVTCSSCTLLLRTRCLTCQFPIEEALLTLAKQLHFIACVSRTWMISLSSCKQYSAINTFGLVRPHSLTKSLTWGHYLTCQATSSSRSSAFQSVDLSFC